MAYFLAGSGVAASQQFGLTRTDVFAVNEKGQLTVSFVDGAGIWQGPLEIGPVNYAPAGCTVAASQQFGLTQTDVFLINNSGQLAVYWVLGSDAWGGPGGIGPAGIAPPGACVAASQQFGANNQTDVFFFDKNGQLNVFWVNNAGAWQGPEKIGAAGIANPGSFLAASRQFGLNQTDVFFVDKNGQLNVFYVDNAGAWEGPVKIGAAGIAPAGCPLTTSQQFGANNQTDVFLFDKNGQLNVFWVNNAGAWQGPEKIGPSGIANPGSRLAASQQFGINQTDVFFVDKNGQLNVCWVVNAGAWGGPGKIGPVGFAPAGCALAASQQFGPADQTDVFAVDNTGEMNVSWVVKGGAWGGPGKMVPVLAPVPGLGSNSNYFLSNCGHITGLAVTIQVSEEIQGSNGFGFQVNAYSSANALDGAQQYCIFTIPGDPQLTAIVDNWFNKSSQVANIQNRLASLPNNILPAGYRLKISLNNDANGNITGATYQAWDNHGNAIGNTTIGLLASGVNQVDLAPIVAFQLNFVGDINGNRTVLSSGSGIITYTASTNMSVLNIEPSCVDWTYSTVEAANSVYSPIYSGSSQVFAQSFNYDNTNIVVQRQSPVMHKLTAGLVGKV